jgi:hypothetical protein
MVQRCPSVEGGAPWAREAALGYGGAPRPAQREGEAMRKAAHDGRSGQRIGERRQRATGKGPFYKRTHEGRVTGWLGRGVQRTTTLGQCEHACAGVEHSEGGSGWRGGDTKRVFVCTSVARR